MTIIVVKRSCDQCREMHRPCVDLAVETSPDHAETHHFCSLFCLEEWTKNQLSTLFQQADPPALTSGPALPDSPR
jgi:hypothetical protein